MTNCEKKVKKLAMMKGKSTTVTSVIHWKTESIVVDVIFIKRMIWLGAEKKTIGHKKHKKIIHFLS